MSVIRWRSPIGCTSSRLGSNPKSLKALFYTANDKTHSNSMANGRRRHGA
ncbi:MAG: hypothetical protein GPOALKHO_000681 [Sodalis sp.]|nr:MAG: hypothetical protein GPOALKHO_000681 [Sodalis sp.]